MLGLVDFSQNKTKDVRLRVDRVCLLRLFMLYVPSDSSERYSPLVLGNKGLMY